MFEFLTKNFIPEEMRFDGAVFSWDREGYYLVFSSDTWCLSYGPFVDNEFAMNFVAQFANDYCTICQCVADLQVDVSHDLSMDDLVCAARQIIERPAQYLVEHGWLNKWDGNNQLWSYAPIGCVQRVEFHDMSTALMYQFAKDVYGTAKMEGWI